MVMSDKTKYKYTCSYCGKTWELPYKIRNIACTICRDDNVKCEEIKITDYYGTKEPEEIDTDDSHYWRD